MLVNITHALELLSVRRNGLMLNEGDLRIEQYEGYLRFFRNVQGKEVEVTPTLTRVLVLMTQIDRRISKALGSLLTTQDSYKDQGGD